MTKQKILEVLTSAGLSLIFTPKRQPTEGGDAPCQQPRTNAEPKHPCSSAPPPTGDGADDLEAREIGRDERG
jgi:hypothetical protein